MDHLPPDLRVKVSALLLALNDSSTLHFQKDPVLICAPKHSGKNTICKDGSSALGEALTGTLVIHHFVRGGLEQPLMAFW
jgi:hypothetical protein